jgi:hypothetical protein
VDVERGAELDVARPVSGEVPVHQAGHEAVAAARAIELNALHERRGAVAHADDRDANLSHGPSCCRLLVAT